MRMLDVIVEALDAGLEGGAGPRGASGSCGSCLLAEPW